MTPTTLRFRARGDSLVQDYEALDAGVRRAIGRKWVEASPGVWGWKATGEAQEVPYRAEYVRECKAGCLEAADQATADACEVELEAPPKAGIAKAITEGVLSAFGKGEDK